MRKGLTLIELIFSMVIIAVVFTVIPKLIQSFAVTNEVAIKEDALFNAISLMSMATSLPWDENNTENDLILNVTDGNVIYDCNATTGYRVGGFTGGRNCIGINANNASLKADFDDGDGFFNDIDDYEGNSTTTFVGCEPNLYEMNTTVTYIYDNNGLIAGAAETTNSKKITVQVNYSPTYKKEPYRNKCITQISYTSYNIGQMQKNKRVWK